MADVQNNVTFLNENYLNYLFLKCDTFEQTWFRNTLLIEIHQHTTNCFT